jgi:sigma-B regulation protein RsbU (phosphoserine phosphatase)
MSRLVLFSVLLWPLTTFGQSMVTVSPQQCVWRAGDNPAWSATTLDESGWQPSAQWKLPFEEPHLWARCHADLRLLRGTAHPAIQISLGGTYQPRPDGAYQLFVNGVRIGGAGDMRTGFVSMNSIRQYPLPAAFLQSGPDTIALRVTFCNPIDSTTPLDIHAGDSEALTWQRASMIQTHNAATPLAEAVFLGVVGLMLLGLFYYDRSRRELLYLSIFCVNSSVMSAETFCSAKLMNLPAALHPAIAFAGNIVAPVALVLFFFTLARRRVPRLYWVAVLVVVAQFTLLGFTILLPADASMHMVGHILAVGRYTQLIVIAQFAISVAPFVAFWPYRQISPHMRPLAILCMLYGVANIVWFALEATATLLRLPSLFFTWQGGVGGANFFVRTCVLVALLGLLFRDQRRVTEERALLAGEMQAAGEIQRMLAPNKIETAQGLHIDVAFHPVREVGGDFHFCRVLRGGRQRVLVGDVSGKGAAAAMAATLLLGAAAARESDSPAELLAQLNRVLHESHVGGFATCLCADFSDAGDVTLANAGHLHPYCNSTEIDLSSSLPLGIAAAAEYAETRLRLAPGETLTFLSDGVVEARNTAGELFGFERTRQCSNQSAEEIASAAQEFGQEDDITVLTVARAAKIEAVTT